MANLGISTVVPAIRLARAPDALVVCGGRTDEDFGKLPRARPVGTRRDFRWVASWARRNVAAVSGMSRVTMP